MEKWGSAKKFLVKNYQRKKIKKNKKLFNKKIIRREIALDTPKNSSLMDRLDNDELKEWSQNQPLSILRLDPIDRAILKISGKESAQSEFLSADIH